MALDIDIVELPTQTGLDIVSLTEMKRHIRIAHNVLDDVISAAVREAAAVLHGADGILNRTVLPCTWVRYLRALPASRIIKLPFPPLIAVEEIRYESAGASPIPTIPSSSYVVRRNVNGVAEIEFLSSVTLPTPDVHPRAVAIVFRAGYEAYPDQIKRFVKILAGHFVENPEATINEVRQFAVNRAVMFGVDSLLATLRIPVAYDDWLD